jgi:hypothetical protein
MKLTILFVLLSLSGSLAQTAPEDKSVRFFLYTDPIWLFKGRTGTQDIGGGILTNKSHLIWAVEPRFYHWYFDAYENNYGRFVTDTAIAPDAFNAWGFTLAVERILPFSLFHWWFLPAFSHEVKQNTLSGWVFGAAHGVTVYTPAGDRADSFTPDCTGNFSLFFGIQVALNHVWVGVRGGYAMERSFAKTNFITDKRNNFIGSLLVGWIN